MEDPAAQVRAETKATAAPALTAEASDVRTAAEATCSGGGNASPPPYKLDGLSVEAPVR